MFNVSPIPLVGLGTESVNNPWAKAVPTILASKEIYGGEDYQRHRQSSERVKYDKLICYLICLNQNKDNIPGTFQAQSTSIFPWSQGPAHDQGEKPLPVQKLYLRYRICLSYTDQQWTPHTQDLKQNYVK